MIPSVAELFFTAKRPWGAWLSRLTHLPASRPRRKALLCLARAFFLALILFSAQAAYAEPQKERPELPSFDFRKLSEAAEWYSVNVVSLTPGLEGLILRLADEGPYLIGPVREYPVSQRLYLHLRLNSTQGGKARVFYFQNEAKEADSVRLAIPAGEWHEAIVALPSLVGRWRLRLDLPGSSGLCLLDRLWFEERLSFPTPPQPEGAAHSPDGL